MTKYIEYDCPVADYECPYYVHGICKMAEICNEPDCDPKDECDAYCGWEEDEEDEDEWEED